MFGELVAPDTEYHILIGQISELKNLKAWDVPLVQIESNFNSKRHVIKLAQSPCYMQARS